MGVAGDLVTHRGLGARARDAAFVDCPVFGLFAPPSTTLGAPGPPLPTALRIVTLKGCRGSGMLLAVPSLLEALPGAVCAPDGFESLVLQDSSSPRFDGEFVKEMTQRFESPEVAEIPHVVPGY